MNQRKSASTPPVPLRRPPPARPREPRPAPAARRVQANGAPAETAHDAIASSGLGWPESGPAGGRLSSSCRPTPSCGGSGAASASTGPSSPAGLRWAARRSAPRSAALVRTNGRGESPVGRPENPWRTPEARHRRGRAHRLPADPEAAHPAVADLAHVPHQPRPGPRRHRFLHRPHRAACVCSSSSSCSPTIAGASSTST